MVEPLGLARERELSANSLRTRCAEAATQFRVVVQANEPRCDRLRIVRPHEDAALEVIDLLAVVLEKP